MLYSVYQIAEALNISKPTVRARIKELKIEAADRSGSKLLYSREAANQIAAAMGKKKNFFVEKSEKSLENTETVVGNSGNSAENAQKIAENAENAADKVENSQAIDSLIQLLREELEKKDKEIAELKEANQKKDERIERLYLTIQENADKALYITAADKTAAIMDKQQKEAAADESKGNFFARLFKRK